ncbi:protocatechuate 3,4-dioxygenase subunit alpha [Sphingobium sp. WTD-1]|uniref:protocatechuate 3,4-dioxygenase subunit alpha n=1 Tax=Pseudomonadota TaxID=1224 RepID=UPI0012BB48A8|nr:MULTISPECIES: protocatechuate 3,4-dioxygenase subunit alpha [Pseudomonadota]MCE4542292.1 protocatechuate 3,4-dioxygenase subunit alpha [Caballeronia sp. PC1]MCE4570457.1 protocatechuate 3,4-dioxygenase subunit alpha [Caballeronia sp. CLC5]QGP77762.1 protocatechuate 3,4-dioxygenase subunit alpha [Sphingobium sp. CAP-1]QKR98448.1 protocatechuate 3,4-dioxygenase subunit alpha [Sphingomonas sp. CL5.1]WIA57778.1 protocatechuate 3,4-dioxygenase subunit alpha [Sphingobium sp. WTD-1]|tara:strand:+ start:25807 stop:26502 length:696 start_codon:yes stop_codon:yes gene_type:complete
MDNDLEKRKASARFDNQDPRLFGQTPWQTVGPFFHYGLPWKGGADLVGLSDLGARPELFADDHYVLNRPTRTGAPRGDVIDIAGQILDGNGDPISDALVESWQANASGRYSGGADKRAEIPLDPEFIGFGRCATDESGVYRFRTVFPGRVPGPGNSLQAPHIALSIFARGVLRRLCTRLYFDGAEGNDTDAILSLVPSDRRSTLVARQRDDGVWWLDIHIQGDAETVFFSL